MPRGIATNEDIKSAVFKLLWDDDRLTGKELKALVEKELSGVNLTIRTYQNLKSDTMPRIEAERARNLDIPWHLGTLVEHDLPPDAVSLVLAIQAMRRHNGKKPLTIRQAHWVSRLSDLFRLKSPPKVLSSLEVLGAWAERYASREFSSKITETDIDTSDLDQLLKYSEAYAVYPFFFMWLENKADFSEDFERFDPLRYALQLRAKAKEHELTDDEQDFVNNVEQFEHELEVMRTREATEILFRAVLDKLPEDMRSIFDQELIKREEEYAQLPPKAREKPFKEYLKMELERTDEDAVARLEAFREALRKCPSAVAVLAKSKKKGGKQ